MLVSYQMIIAGMLGVEDGRNGKGSKEKRGRRTKDILR